MSRTAWVAGLLTFASAAMLVVPDEAVGQGSTSRGGGVGWCREEHCGQAQGAADAVDALSGGTASQTGSNVGRNEDTHPASQAQSAVDAISAFGGGRTAGAETGTRQGWGGNRSSNTRTPSQDYEVKTRPYFYEDRSRYPQQ